MTAVTIKKGTAIIAVAFVLYGYLSLLFIELFLSELHFIEIVVRTSVFKQLCVIAFFDYFAVRKNDYLICVLNCGKSMRNHKHRSDIHHLFKRILNKKLGFRIYVCRRLVKYHNLGLVRYSSSEGKKLALTLREVIATLTHWLVKSRFKLVYEAICVNVFTGFPHEVVGNAFFTESDIRANIAREKKYVLKHLTEMTAQGGDLYLFDIYSVNKYLSLLDIVISADKGENSGLTRAR